MPDASRVFDGFRNLAAGVNSGVSPSLIPRDQCARASNVTFRKGYPTTRPPYTSWPLTFNNTTTQSRFIGIFQGALQYDGEIGQSGWLVSRGGRLFFITNDTFVVSEVTPKLSIVTTADFVVPAVNATVNVPVNSESAIATGDTVYVDSGQYLVVNRFTDGLVLKYLATAANATAKAGSGVLNSSQTQIFEYEPNPSTYDFVFMFQAETYGIVLGGQHKTIIFDGSQCRRASYNEVPPGALGAYGWGRIWIARPDMRTFVAGDIVGGPSGTFQSGFRDAVLKFTENDFLNEGGAFAVPHNAGPITAMQFLASQDTSLGIGVLLVGTTNMVFSVNAPVDRTTWKNLQYPIQTVSLLDYGPQSPRGTISVNGDMWYRSIAGIQSFIVARRNYGSPGNTPMSREVAEVLDYDTKPLLFHGSGVFFDNKLFQTVSPIRTSKGVEHRGLVTINFDLISSLQGKTSPAWEGVSTGLNVLQFTKGLINNTERAFAFVAGADDIELWELNTSGYYDEKNTLAANVVTKARQPIPAFLETRSQDYQDAMALKSMHMAEIYLEDIVDTVNFTIKYRPDQYPCWIPWKSFSVCAAISQCSVPTPGAFDCSVIRMNEKLYAARITIPQPDDDCNTVAGGRIRDGHEFQHRIEWTGHCRIRAFRTHAKLKTEPMEGACPETTQCKVLTSCCDQLFASTGSGVGGGGGIDPDDGSGGGGAFFNTRQCYTATCPPGLTGPPVQVCIEAADPLYSSNVNQADADAQALAAATAKANSLLLCNDVCGDGFTFNGALGVCQPTCHDESCTGGWQWNGSAWECYTGSMVGGLGGVCLCTDLVTGNCIKDFTFISRLVGELPTHAFPPPYNADPYGYNCDIPIQYNLSGVGANSALVHPEYQYGNGVDANRLYTVTIRVRGVFEMKGYFTRTGAFAGNATGHRDPNQPFVVVLDSFIGPFYPAGWKDATTDAMCPGGENEYRLEVIDTDGRFYVYPFNNSHEGLADGAIQAVDFTFKIQVKKDWVINLYGTSVDNREYPNPPVPGFDPIVVHGEPIAIKRTQPYPGQFMQLDVIAIDYPV